MRVKFFAVEICLALEDFHKRDVIYRELVPENIIINEKGHVFLTDFGNSRFLLDVSPPSYIIPYLGNLFFISQI